MKNNIINHEKFNQDELIKLEDYIYFKQKTSKKDFFEDYEKVVDENFDDEIKILYDEFLSLINDDDKFNYNINEFEDWIKEQILIN